MVAEATLTRRLAAILAADVAGYSRLMADDEAGTLTAFRRLRTEIIDPGIAAHHGRVVGSAGDSLLVEFASAVDAVRCATELQSALAEINVPLPSERRMSFRMGVNVGDVIFEADTIHGDGVNVAARLEKLAEPGGLVIARSVYDQVKGKTSGRFEDMGELSLHNIAEPVRAYGVVSEPRGAVRDPGTLSGEEAARRRQSIAVLPFANMSGDAEQEYFSDGITEDLITALARHHGLFVIARNSSFVFKGKSAPIQEVGQKLGVRYVVEGSVRKSGKRIRVTAQLIDAETGAHLWAEKYDRDLEDVFAVQDEIVETLVWRVAGHVGKAELAALRRKQTPPIDAYEFYLAGMELFNRLGHEDLKPAIALFERALAIDPGFGRAYTGIGYCINMIGQYTAREEPKRVYDLLRKAVSLDDSDDEACGLLAYICESLGSASEADVWLERAFAINPNSAAGTTFGGWVWVWRGEFDKAMIFAERGSRLNPLAKWDIELAGTVHFLTGRHEDALRAFARVPLYDYYWQHYIRAAALAELGRLDEGRKAMAEAIRLRPQLSVGDHMAFHPFRADLVERMVNALRKVGLPEA